MKLVLPVVNSHKNAEEPRTGYTLTERNLHNHLKGMQNLGTFRGDCLIDHPSLQLNQVGQGFMF